MKRIHPFKRVLKHLLMPNWRVHQVFPKAALRNIEEAIAAGELKHSGQIRFAVEANLTLPQLIFKLKPQHRAIKVFSDLHVWDTEKNNGVLIYLVLADRDVEIVADRGIHNQVGSETWEKICVAMEAQFKLGHFEQGVIQGIQLVSQQLEQFSPATTSSKNELSNRPVLL